MIVLLSITYFFGLTDPPYCSLWRYLRPIRTLWVATLSGSDSDNLGTTDLAASTTFEVDQRLVEVLPRPDIS
jgi:hypothetical protein